jgi:pyrroloquinoline quinone (PQQ) biosynthesis protein C
VTDQILSLEALEAKLFAMANEQFESREYRHLFSIPLSLDSARHYIQQRQHFVFNRRGCWAAVQSSAPFDVKKMIWEHEQDELQGDAERGVADHYTLGIQEGASVGLSPADFENSPPPGSVEIACYAWLHLARDKPWLEGLASSSILEVANSDAVVKSGGISRHMGNKMRDDLGIGFDKQHSNAEHVVAELEHATLLSIAARKYGQTAEGQAQILRGARASLTVDRIYRGALAHEMEALSAAAAA